MSTVQDLLGVLARLGVAQAKDLEKALGVSQPTVSRLIKAAGGDVCRMGHTRATRYARTRALPRLGTRLALHRISEAGRIEPFGESCLLEGGGHWVTLEKGCAWFDIPAGGSALFEGMPPFIVDMCPQGYMGRTFGRRYPDLGLPSDITHWTDDDQLIALARHGEDCVGNLILGEESLNHWLAHSYPSAHREDYPELARSSDREQYGSSAGGEHPKFLTFSRGRHVLVKFASLDAGAVARRWMDLLVCESFTLDILREAGIDATTAHWFDAGGYRFLEVERFDRVGERGRRGMISLRALDNEYVGEKDRTTWTSLAPRLQEKDFISLEDARRMRWLDVFGQLTGNSDRHLGNLSFLQAAEGDFHLAPAYDMLPMMFVPSATAVPDRPFKPDPPNLRTLDVWKDAAHHASLFWTRALEHPALSDGFRSLARACRETLEALRERVPL